MTLVRAVSLSHRWCLAAADKGFPAMKAGLEEGERGHGGERRGIGRKVPSDQSIHCAAFGHDVLENPLAARVWDLPSKFLL
jgi:hypothetical protein